MQGEKAQGLGQLCSPMPSLKVDYSLALAMQTFRMALNLLLYFEIAPTGVLTGVDNLGSPGTFRGGGLAGRGRSLREAFEAYRRLPVCGS